MNDENSVTENHTTSTEHADRTAEYAANAAKARREHDRAARVIGVTNDFPPASFEGASIGDMLARLLCPTEQTRHALPFALEHMAAELSVLRVAVEAGDGDVTDPAAVLYGLEVRARVLAELARRLDADEEPTQ